MSVDPRNNGTIIGGIVATPEFANDNKSIVKFRLAVDYAGRDTAKPDNKSGYFDVVAFRNDDQNSKFLFDQIEQGKMDKGSQVAIAYRLNHSRWQSDAGESRQRIELIAEAVTYVGGGKPAEKSEGSSGSAAPAPAQSAASVPDKF